MNSTQIIALRIKAQAKKIGKPVSSILSECEMNKNAVNKISKGADITSQNLAKIADKLECSVDYLLGRTDIPDIENDNDAQLFNLLKGLSDVDKADFIVAIKQKLSVP